MFGILLVSIPLGSAYHHRVSPTHPSIELQAVVVPYARQTKAGLIGSRRGEVTILDRKGLENLSCECYGIINRQMEAWRKDVM